MSGETLRELPIGVFAREATREVAHRLVRDGDAFRLISAWGPGGVLEPVEWDDDTPVYSGASEPVPDEQRFDAEYARAMGAPRRRGPLRENELRDIAGVYRAAVASHDPPTRAVAARFGVSRSTAGRWIMEARKRGELGKALPRMAGEIIEEEDG